MITFSQCDLRAQEHYTIKAYGKFKLAVRIAIVYSVKHVLEL